MKALHIRFEGFTSTFKVPFINSGVMISLPVPSYSSIVGLISCCVGRWIEKEETLIGFKYEYDGIGRDLETTKRLEVDKKEILKRKADKGISTKEFHVNPKLDLYLSNTKLARFFLNPVGVPTLGRSQDISWITKVEEIEINRCDEGNIKPTLIPFPCEYIGGRVIRLCDYFYNDKHGYLRKPDRLILYQVVPQSQEGVYIKRNNLYSINDSSKVVIYMHKLGDES